MFELEFLDSRYEKLTNTLSCVIVTVTHCRRTLLQNVLAQIVQLDHHLRAWLNHADCKPLLYVEGTVLAVALCVVGWHEIGKPLIDVWRGKPYIFDENPPVS